MSDLRPKDLIHAEKLLYQGKPAKALEKVVNFENRGRNTLKEKLWVLLLKGWVNVFEEHFKEAAEMGEYAYRLSGELEMVHESAEALILYSYIRDQNKSSELLSKAEEILHDLTEKTNFLKISTLNIELLVKKSWSYFIKGEINGALEVALKSLEQAQKVKQTINIAYIFQLLSSIYLWKGELKISLDYGEKSKKLMEEIGFQIGVASSLLQIIMAYVSGGELNKGLEVCEKGLSMHEIGNRTKGEIHNWLGHIYLNKGDLNLALEHFTTAVQISEEESGSNQTIPYLISIGGIQILRSNYDDAIKYFDRSLMLSQQNGIHIQAIWATYFLFISNLLNHRNEKTLYYLESLRELTDKITDLKSLYFLAKAIMLKRSKLSRDRAEAEKLLKQIVESKITYLTINRDALVHLCDYLIEELEESNDLKILDEITPLIHKIQENAKNQNSFRDIAEVQLLLAKLAMIKLNINEAKLLLTKAQEVADKYGLQLLARRISREHDKLLEEIEEWQALKKKNSKISERIKRVSVDDVLNRLQGIRAIDPLKLVDEDPILLLIISEGGIPAFSYSFTQDLTLADGMISNFLSAFSSFSEELFSKRLDRAKFEDYKLIIASIGPFSACYLFKGQTYVAKQKLIQFAHRVQNTPSIWRTFEDFNKTHQSIELKENPSLESLITEIFIKNSGEFSTPI